MSVEQHTRDFGDRPLVAGSVRGVRAFQFIHYALSAGSPDKLVSLGHQHIWEPGVNAARCIPVWPVPDREHDVASIGCSCGIYAYWASEADNLRDRTGWDRRVIGIIEGHGTLVAGARGFRSEKARIVALVARTWGLAHDQEEKLRAVAAEFGVPLFDTLDEALVEFPLTTAEDVGCTSPAPGQVSVPVGAVLVSTTMHLGAGQSYAIHAASMREALAKANMVDQIKQEMAAAAAAVSDLGSALKPLVYNGTLRYKRGGFVPGRMILDETTPPPAQTPVEKKRAARQAAADARSKAGLRNVGGFDRRGGRR